MPFSLAWASKNCDKIITLLFNEILNSVSIVWQKIYFILYLRHGETEDTHESNLDFIKKVAAN